MSFVYLGGRSEDTDLLPLHPLIPFNLRQLPIARCVCITLESTSLKFAYVGTLWQARWKACVDLNPGIFFYPYNT